MPRLTNRSQENSGFEVFSEVLERAALWVAQQRGVRFTNVQTVNAKVKKGRACIVAFLQYVFSDYLSAV